MGVINVPNLPNGTILQLPTNNMGPVNGLIGAGGGGGGALDWNYAFISGAPPVASIGGALPNTWASWFGPPPMFTVGNFGSPVVIAPDGAVSIPGATGPTPLQLIMQVSGRVQAATLFELEWVLDFNNTLLGGSADAPNSTRATQLPQATPPNGASTSISVVQIVSLTAIDTMRPIFRCTNDTVLFSIEKIALAAVRLAS